MTTLHDGSKSVTIDTSYQRLEVKTSTNQDSITWLFPFLDVNHVCLFLNLTGCQHVVLESLSKAKDGSRNFWWGVEVQTLIQFLLQSLNKRGNIAQRASIKYFMLSTNMWSGWKIFWFSYLVGKKQNKTKQNKKNTDLMVRGADPPPPPWLST